MLLYFHECHPVYPFCLITTHFSARCGLIDALELTYPVWHDRHLTAPQTC